MYAGPPCLLRKVDIFSHNLVVQNAFWNSDAVRCLENAMLIVAGEKNIFRAVVTPIISRDADEDDENLPLAPFLKKAGVAAYSHAAAAVVDRVLDIIETVFLKEGGIGQSSGAKGDATTGLTVSAAASAAAAGLRILDGVRMLGPSLAKLCEMPVGNEKTGPNTTIASTLCISIHRTTVVGFSSRMSGSIDSLCWHF